MDITQYILTGIIIFVLDVYAIINVINSGIEPLRKAIWIIIILLFPLLGVLLWFLIGPKNNL